MPGDRYHLKALKDEISSKKRRGTVLHQNTSSKLRRGRDNIEDSFAYGLPFFDNKMVSDAIMLGLRWEMIRLDLSFLRGFLVGI
ncbi:hypothetical protein NC651_024660 [Populus alba x Populus x berolinensis]|nr:hypothetical protein NC651_024660 [Populus alba x Populus x berolinensis]